MKATPKRFSYSAINLVTMMLMGIMYTSCTTNCDDCPMEEPIHPRMAIELTLEANTANMATAMNAVYADMLTDSLKRVGIGSIRFCLGFFILLIGSVRHLGCSHD